jgi:type I restriction enzyme R subunit
MANRREAQVIYHNLPGILAASHPASEVHEAALDENGQHLLMALEIDRAMREQAPAGWRGDDARERQVLNALFPILGRNRQATQAVFELIRNQPGYS